MEQLKKDPIKSSSYSRNEMMFMLLHAWEFKSFFVTNALDESEDYFVLDKLLALVGVEMVDFRNELMSQNLFLIKSYS